MYKKIFLTVIYLLVLVLPVYAIECESASQCVIIGQKMIEQKEYEKALKCFDNALLMDSQSYLAHAYRAKTNFYLGRYEQMLEDTTKSIEIYPNDRAYGLRGSAKLALGNNLGAIEDVSKALELNPKYMKCYEVRARAEANIGDYISALKDANRAINLRKDYAKAYEVLGYAQVGIKDYLSAIESFKIAEDLFKNQGDRKSSNKMKSEIKKYKRFQK